jgi:hypothetical protein
MNYRFTMTAGTIVLLLTGCAYMDFQRGAYESIRSREASSQAASPGGVQRTMPTYDQYERERSRIRGAAQPDTPAPSAAPSSEPAK